MKNKTYLNLILLLSVILLFGCKKDEAPTSPKKDPPSLTLFKKQLFFDGYAEPIIDGVRPGIKRLSNTTYVTKLTKEQIALISDKLELEIIIGAACDNYDRIGNVFLNLLNQGDEFSKLNVVKRIEIARFITPFMDKNKLPNSVPYTFEIDNIAKILTASNLSEKYDFWVEFSVGGTTGAGRKQIKGCSESNLTFLGTLTLHSPKGTANKTNQYLFPIAASVGLNNYDNTDILGQTIKSFEIDVSSTIKNAKLYLITSNHGSNRGGEEYVRREHFVYFDGSLIAKYKPGGKSCEPYRKYNTQGNGIYGASPQTTKWWTSWNNWCPGDKIPIRVYDLGNLEKGKHIFKIEVPDAKFVDGQGYFPLSAYIQGNI